MNSDTRDPNSHDAAFRFTCLARPPVLRRIVVGFVVLAVAGASPAAAQQPWPVSVEFNFGAGDGGSSVPHESGRGVSLDALLGFRPGVRTAGGFVVAGSVSGQGFAGGSASCDAIPGVACKREFPDFWLMSALAGWESSNAGVRLLVGPAVATAKGTRVGAVHTRVDVAKPIFGRVSLLASGRFAYIPRYRGASFRLAAIGLGLRLR